LLALSVRLSNLKQKYGVAIPHMPVPLQFRPTCQWLMASEHVPQLLFVTHTNIAPNEQNHLTK